MLLDLILFSYTISKKESMSVCYSGIYLKHILMFNIVEIELNLKILKLLFL
jgi:hypothetical protein